MKQIDDFTRSILRGSTVENGVLKLPPGQLCRDDYRHVDEVLRSLGGKWDRKARGHVFPFDPAELVRGAAEDGRYTDRRKDLQFLETPEPLAERMAALSNVQAGSMALEPSAGLGRLVRPLLARGAVVVAVEIDPTNAEHLRSLDVVGVHVVDFAIWGNRHACYSQPFDAVVMNPPFRTGLDMAHIELAWRLLRPAGRLVALCSEGPFFRQDTRSLNFRCWLERIRAHVERLPENSFRESGTGVRARLIVADMPHQRI